MHEDFSFRMTKDQPPNLEGNLERKCFFHDIYYFGTLLIKIFLNVCFDTLPDKTLFKIITNSLIGRNVFLFFIFISCNCI